MSDFSASVTRSVTEHMNGDHREDNLLIAQAFGCPDAVASTMIGLDAHAGFWRVTHDDGERSESDLRIAWPHAPITARPQIRREIVALYRTACGKLGVSPRAEHQDKQQTERVDSQQPRPQPGFAAVIRNATRSDHSESEHDTVMTAIMRGKASIELYTGLVTQHYFLYTALDAAAQCLADDAEYAPLHPAGLPRGRAIAEDLHQLLGNDWRTRIAPLPATASYTDRIEELAAQRWLPGIVAHHYTRYLGDLSGGQAIARQVRGQYGFTRAGAAFYEFSELGDIVRFRQRYRAVLDTLGQQLPESERLRMIAEVRAAYRYNTEMFADIQRAYLAAR